MSTQTSGVSAGRIIPLLLTLCLLSTACTSHTANMTQLPKFHNPIAPVADPFVALYQGNYYLTGTYTGGNLHLWHGPHLEKVTENEATLIWSPEADQPAYQVWSPTMFLLDYLGQKHWFVYFTASTDNTNESHRIYVLQSSGADPLGPYTFKGQLGGTDETTAIDASLLQLDGKLYLMYVLQRGTNAIYIAPMSDPLTISGEPQLLIDPDQSWERGGDTGQSTYPVAEGPTPLYHNGNVFIVYSASDTGNYNYCLGLLTYDGTGDPLNRSSWTKSGPVFEHSRENGVFGPGRAIFTTSPDGKQDWMVYHAKTTDEYVYTGRETRIQPFTWRPDGTPDFGVPVSITTELNSPSANLTAPFSIATSGS